MRNDADRLGTCIWRTNMCVLTPLYLMSVFVQSHTVIKADRNAAAKHPEPWALSVFGQRISEKHIALLLTAGAIKVNKHWLYTSYSLLMDNLNLRYSNSHFRWYRKVLLPCVCVCVFFVCMWKIWLLLMHYLILRMSWSLLVHYTSLLAVAPLALMVS